MKRGVNRGVNRDVWTASCEEGWERRLRGAARLRIVEHECEVVAALPVLVGVEGLRLRFDEQLADARVAFLRGDVAKDTIRRCAKVGTHTADAGRVGEAQHQRFAKCFFPDGRGDGHGDR